MYYYNLKLMFSILIVYNVIKNICNLLKFQQIVVAFIKKIQDFLMIFILMNGKLKRTALIWNRNRL